jgi:hypothetical protein
VANPEEETQVNYRLHDTRHTVATSMAVANVPEPKRKYLMGHTSESVIRKYTHLQAEDCRADVERAFAMRESSNRVPPVDPRKRESSNVVPPVSTPVSTRKLKTSLQ